MNNNAYIIDVSDCRKSNQVLIKSKLDWTVSIRPIYFGNDGSIKQIEDKFAIVRDSDNKYFTVVGNRYKIHNNSELFSFIDEHTNKYGLRWSHAGCWNDGGNVFVALKMPQHIVVKDDIIDNYLIISSAHNGTAAIKISLAPVRVINNTIVNPEIGEVNSFITFKHLISKDNKLNYIHKILEHFDNHIYYLNDIFNKLSDVEINEETVAQMIVHNVTNDNEYRTCEDNKINYLNVCNRIYDDMIMSSLSMRKLNRINRIWEYYKYNINQAGLTNTLYGVYTAISGYYSTNDKDIPVELQRFMFDTTNKYIKRTTDYLIWYINKK